MSFRIRKFSVSNSKPNKVWLVIGSRGTGKTTLIKDIIEKTHNRYSNPLVMCRTAEAAEFFKTVTPEGLVFSDGYDYDKADEFLDVCRKNVKSGMKNLLVLDDCMFDTKVLKSRTMEEIHMNGRHYNITLLNVTQYLMNVPASIRANVDYVMVLKESSMITKKKNVRKFFQLF